MNRLEEKICDVKSLVNRMSTYVKWCPKYVNKALNNAWGGYMLVHSTLYYITNLMCPAYTDTIIVSDGFAAIAVILHRHHLHRINIDNS